MNNIQYTVVRTGRKTIELRIMPDRTIRVTAPYSATDEYISGFISSKRKWIEEHLQKLPEAVKPAEKHSIKIGDMLMYRGKEYPLVGIKENRVGFKDDCFYIYESISQDAIAPNLIAVYKKLALPHFIARTAELASKLKLTPLAVKISSAKTRWGSCSGRDSINFSWRLIMADDDAIDYVIVHELTHISEKNHGKKFWDKVEAVMPDYKRREQSLKRLSERLYTEDWD